MTSQVVVTAHCADDKEVVITVNTETGNETYFLKNKESTDFAVYDDRVVTVKEQLQLEDGKGFAPRELRVIKEKAELDKKLIALNTFTISEAFNTISEEDKTLLLKQQTAMMAYSDILASRILTF